MSQLPLPVVAYVQGSYKGTGVTAAGSVLEARGKISYEAEVNRKDIIFDEKGNFGKAK